MPCQAAFLFQNIHTIRTVFVVADQLGNDLTLVTHTLEPAHDAEHRKRKGVDTIEASPEQLVLYLGCHGLVHWTVAKGVLIIDGRAVLDEQHAQHRVSEESSGVQRSTPDLTAGNVASSSL